MITFLIGLLLGVGIGSFLGYVYFSIMFLGTEQTLAEKAPKEELTERISP